MALPRTTELAALPTTALSATSTRTKSAPLAQSAMIAITLPDGGVHGEIATLSLDGAGVSLAGLGRGRHRGSHGNGALAGAKGTGTQVANIGGIGDGLGDRAGTGHGNGHGHASRLGTGASGGVGIGLASGSGGHGYGESSGDSANGDGEGDAGSSTISASGGGHRGDQTSAALGDGRGLSAEYYVGAELTNFAFKRVDPVIGFPERFIPIDPRVTRRYSIRWSGYIQPLWTETYTFAAGSDDGSRVLINGRQIINMWKDQPILWQSGQIDLVAGRLYKIVIEYYEDGTGPAEMEFTWSSAHQPKGPIPNKQLYPE